MHTIVHAPLTAKHQNIINACERQYMLCFTSISALISPRMFSFHRLETLHTHLLSPAVYSRKKKAIAWI